MITYLDTSALVKTIIAEPETEIAMDIWNASDVRLTSLITYAEARAALAAASRDRRLAGRARTAARETLDHRWLDLVEAAVSDEVVHLAGDLADSDPLRAFDAVHLASALLASDGGELLFATWDRSLSRTARRMGVATNLI